MDRKPAAATAYVGGEARHYDELRFTSASGRLINTIESNILMEIADELPPGSRIMEVGCGTGRLLLDLCKKGFRCDGLDASPDMIEQAGNKIYAESPDTRLHVGEAAHLPQPDDSFDLVYGIRLLNQTASIEYALETVREMLRVTKPGGVMLAEFVNHYRPRRKSVRKTTVYLKPAQVIQAAKSAGGAPVRIHGAFFFGMTAQHRVPNPLRPTLTALDAIVCKLAPRLSARCYVQFIKH